MSQAVSFREAVSVWARIGLLSFGGPAAQIALLHRYLVEQRRWISERDFGSALNFCMLLPGPEAQQLATFCGWLLHGTRGALVAGVFFLLPGLAAIIALATLVATRADLPALQGALYGLTAVTLGLVAVAFVRFTRRVLRDSLSWFLAVVTLAALWIDLMPFPLLIAAAAAIGAMRSAGPSAESSANTPPYAASVTRSLKLRQTLATSALWLAVWLAPTILAAWLLGASSTLAQLGAFFSKTALVTFGGAYAILGYVSTESVANYSWLTSQQMMQGLALAETTPGPLVLVLSYIGFLGAFGHPEALPPLLAGVLGALLVAWATFVPSFLWILTGAPWVERITQNTALRGALAAITAVAVGAMAKLALWFASHALFSQQQSIRALDLRIEYPVASMIDPIKLLGALVAAGLLASNRATMGLVIIGGAALGLSARALGLI